MNYGRKKHSYVRWCVPSISEVRVTSLRLTRCYGLLWCCLYSDVNSASLRGAAPRRSGLLRDSHVNLLPILTGQIKANTCDWAVEGKGVAGGFRERRRSKIAWPREAINNKGSHSCGID